MFRRRTILLLLFALCLISVAMRYPLVEHERHNDTFTIQMLASSIVDRHYAVWTFSPLSYIGYYPASYPSGMPFLMAELSELTGLRVELAILIESFFVGVMSVMVVFGLAGQFIQRKELVLLATLFAAVGPRLVDTSYWNGSSRAIFVVMTILLVFVAFRAASSGLRSLYFVAALSFVGCFALHHMAVLLILLGLAYVSSALGTYAFSKTKSFSAHRMLAKGTVVAYIVALFFLTAAISVFSLSQYSKEIERMFGDDAFFSFEPSFLSIIMNMAVSYTHQIGFVLPVAILGIPFFIRRSRMSVRSLLLVILPLLFIPILASSLYITMLLAPFIAILATTCLGYALKGRKRKLAAVFVVSLICISLILPIVSSIRWNSHADPSGDTVEVNDQFYNDGAYLREYSDDALMMSNTAIVTLRLTSISGVAGLGSDVLATLSGDVTADSTKENITWSDEEFPNNIYLLFEHKESNEITLLVLMFVLNGMSYATSQIGSLPGAAYYSSHSKLLVAIDNHWPTSFVWQYGIFQAKLPLELKNAEWQPSSYGGEMNLLSSYMIYQSQRISLYALEIPT